MSRVGSRTDVPRAKNRLSGVGILVAMVERTCKGILTIALLFVVLLAGCGSRLEPAQLRTEGEHVGEIHGEHTVGQTFVTQHDGLSAVDVLLSTLARHNTQPVTFHLKTDPGSDTDLRTVTVLASEIVDKAYHRFSFEPIPDSHHRRYYFFIDSPQSQPGYAITAWIGPADSYREGSLYLSGQAQEAQLAFKLNYSVYHIIIGLVRDLLASIPAILAVAALVVLPGLTLLLWMAPVRQWSVSVVVIVAIAISTALFPLALLWSRSVGLRWNSSLVWGWLVLCFGLSAWRVQLMVKSGRFLLQWPGWRRLWRRPALDVWLLWGVFFLVMGVRWLVARPLSVPMWGDSHQHTYIAQLLIDNGGLFDSWSPLGPYNSLTVHFGFHVTVALFHWVTGMSVLRSVVLVGQIINGLAVLTLYPLAVQIGRNTRLGNRRGHWTGIASVLVAGLLMPMPMEYVNWGRYPQLAGQMILPVAVWLLWMAVENQGRAGWKTVVLAALTAAGMTLSYYRMPYYYAAFVMAWLPFYAGVEWRRNRTRWFVFVQRAVVMGLLILLLVIPWGSNLVGGRLASDLVTAVGNSPSIERVKADYQLWRDIDTYVPVYLCVLSVVALVWSMVKRQWRVLLLGLWTALLALLVSARLVHLPGASHMQSFAILIALYMPVGIIVGWLIAGLLTAMMQPLKKWGVGVAGAAVLLVALLGFRQRAAVVNPAYALVNRSDEVAMEWIRANTTPDALFLVNGFLIYGGVYAAGSDAGWWIPYLAGRQNTMPPQYALFNERETIPGYGRSVVQLVADLETNSPTSPKGVEALCQSGVTHVYVGQGQGRIALEPLSPYLVPAELDASPYYDLIYHEDRVWIFSFLGAGCS